MLYLISTIQKLYHLKRPEFNNNMNEDIIIYRAIGHLDELLKTHNVDVSHGIEHAKKVEEHTHKALSYSNLRDTNKRLAIRLAALLHDADDRKFFPNNKNYENARYIIEIVLPTQKDIQKHVISLIDMVSFSKNGNSLFGTDIPEESLYPCIADRCEALGKRGIVRCYQYTIHVNRPVYTENTVRCTSVEDIRKISTQKRLNIYLQKKESDTMIDHFYDKLCHLNVEIKNPYLKAEMTKGMDEIYEFLIKFGKTGELTKSHINKIILELDPPKRKKKKKVK